MDLVFSQDEMWLIVKIIKEQRDNVERGLPLGNISSQWFSLFFLNRIDRLIKKELRVKSYVRYMDDFILVHRDKKYLQYCLKRINEVCNNELDLKLNEKTQIVISYNRIDFLGFRHTLLENGKVKRKLRLSAKKRMRKHLKALKTLKSKNLIDDEYIRIRKNAFYAHVLYSDELYFQRICRNDD